MSVQIITKDNFKEEILHSNQPVLLDFYANWCGPCRMLAPTIEQIANEHPEIKVGKINIDEQIELAEQFKVMTIPTLVVIKDGKVTQQVSGVRPKAQILSMI